MATVTIKGKAYENISVLYVRALDEYEEQGKRGTIVSLRVIHSGTNDAEDIEIKVPSYLRVDVDGSVEYVVSNRVEVYGKVGELVASKANVVGTVKDYATTSKGFEQGTKISGKGKVRTLADVAKDMSRTLDRATVIHVNGDIKKVDVDDFDAPMYMDVVIKGNVLGVASQGVVSVKGSVVKLVSMFGAKFTSKPDFMNVTTPQWVNWYFNRYLNVEERDFNWKDIQFIV